MGAAGNRSVPSEYLTAFKGVEQIVWQRFEKRFRDLELVLSEADRSFGFSQLRHRANFSHWRISLAQEDRFAFSQSIQILREMGFGLVHIQPDHRSLLN
jgi:hypothetical protein